MGNREKELFEKIVLSLAPVVYSRHNEFEDAFEDRIKATKAINKAFHLLEELKVAETCSSRIEYLERCKASGIESLEEEEELL